MRNLLNKLQRRNGFKLMAKPPGKNELVHVPRVDFQRNIASNISAINIPAAVMQSFAHIDFRRFNFEPPIQVALVREPLARAVSWFYHVRAPFQVVERHTKFPQYKLPSRSFLKKDLETCLKNQDDQECRYPLGRQHLGHTIEFFCGHEPYCPIFGDEDGLSRAKKVVEQEFLVVGILEEWNKTLSVLEATVPRFFNGAFKIYHDKISNSKKMRNENFYKPTVEKKYLELLRRNFTVEIEFYNFLKQRLLRQYESIALLPSQHNTESSLM